MIVGIYCRLLEKIITLDIVLGKKSTRFWTSVIACQISIIFIIFLYTVDRRDEGQKVQSRSPDRRPVGQERKVSSNCTQSKPDQRDNHQIKEEVESEKPQRTGIDEQFDGAENRTGNVVPAHLQNGLDASDDHDIYGTNIEGSILKVYQLY